MEPRACYLAPEEIKGKGNNKLFNFLDGSDTDSAQIQTDFWVPHI